MLTVAELKYMNADELRGYFRPHPAPLNPEEAQADQFLVTDFFANELKNLAHELVPDLTDFSNVLADTQGLTVYKDSFAKVLVHWRGLVALSKGEDL